jgi:hypothetical protein
MRAAAQKCLTARSASRTAPETAVIATMLMTFCVTIDISDAVCAGRRLVLVIFRFAREVFFADINPSMQVKLFEA